MICVMLWLLAKMVLPTMECLWMVVLLMPSMLTIAMVMLWLDRKATT